MASLLLQRLSLLTAFLFIVHLPATRQQIRSTATTLEDMKSLLGGSESELKLTTTMAESVFDPTTQDLTAEFRGLVSPSDAWRLKMMRDQTCMGSGVKVFNFSRRTLSEVLDISRDLFPVVLLPPSSSSEPPRMTTVKNPSALITSEKLPPPSTSSKPASNSGQPPMTSSQSTPPFSQRPSNSNQPPLNSSEPPMLSSQPPSNFTRPPLNSSEPPPPSSQRPSNSNQPPLNSSEPPMLSSQPPSNFTRPPLYSSEPPPPSSQRPLNSSEPPLLSTQPPANFSRPPMTSGETLPPTTAPSAAKGRRKRGASALETQFVEHKIRIKRAASDNTSESGGSRFLQFVCCQSQANMTVLLRSLDKEATTKMVSPSLLAMLTKETLMALKSALPDTALLCNGLLEAEVQDLITITQVFACMEQVQKLVQSSSYVAAAFLDQFRARIGNLSADEWKMLISNFSSSLPQDLLDKAPVNVIMDNFQTLYSRERASVLLQKINLTAVNASFLNKLGDKMCDFPRSALDKIPPKVLQNATEALVCVGTSDDAGLKSLVAKLFNASDVASCKTFLTTVDPLLERCWDLLSGNDTKSINFTSLEKFGKLPVQLTRKLRDKMNLGDPKSWTERTLNLYPWLIGTLLPDQLASLAPALLKSITTSSSMAQVDMPASVQRQVYATQMKSMDKAPANLTSSDLKTMRNLLPAMSPSDAKSLSSDAVGSLVGELAADVQKMAKTTRETILNKLTTAQLQEKLCQMGNLSEDVSAQQLEKGNSLGDILLNSSNCQYKCQQQAQCYAVYSSMMKAIVARGYGLSNITKDHLARMRDTRAICGISLDDVDQLPATAAIESWQAAFMEASCENLKAAQAIAEKYRLVLTYVTKTGITKTNVAQLGPQAIVNTDLTELRALDTDGKKTVVQLMGRQPLYDASADWNKQMLGYAYDAYLSGNASAEINSTTALAFGYLLCSLNSTSYKQLTPSAILDAAPILGTCPELSQSDLLTLQQVMVSKTNKSCSNMDADDVAIRGTILFADCGTQSCLDQIPPRSLYEAVSRLVEAVKDREESVDMREGQWKKSALSDADKQGLIDIVTCGLLKALDARARYRAQTPSSTPATRRKRSTASQQVTCEDILILDTKSNVLTVQQINDLNTTDFDNCAETLGTATGWSLEQKAALIGKAKQTWGQQSSNWTKELIQRMGSIAQGLSESEITSLANLDLDVLSTLGQYTGWTLDQLKSGFSSWLKKYINNNISAITGSHLQQIGDFACGATAQQISSISTSAFKDALNKIGTLYSCSAEQLEAWASLGLQALGSVTEWTYAQSATFDVLYAGLSGSSLSLLSSTQLSMISLDVFVRIKPTAFSALTVSQMASLSTAQALSVTADQLSVLNPAQKAQLRALGATISDPSGAPGVSVTASTLAATWTAVWLIMAY